MEVIVADSGIQHQQTARTFAEFSGLSCRFDLDGAKSVGADTGQQLAVGGLRNVEAIEQGHGLIGFRAGDVRLSVQILHDAGDEVEHIAIVVRGRKRNVEYIESAEGLLRGDLGGIDGWRRLDHIDYLANLLLAGESDIDIGRKARLDRRQYQ